MSIVLQRIMLALLVITMITRKSGKLLNSHFSKNWFIQDFKYKSCSSKVHILVLLCSLHFLFIFLSVVCVCVRVRWGVWAMVHSRRADPGWWISKGSWLGLWRRWWCWLLQDSGEPALLLSQHSERPCLLCFQQLLSEKQAQRWILLLQGSCYDHRTWS